MGRFKLLISTAVVVTGPVDGGVGVESFLQRRVKRSGQSPSFSPRLGLEVEPIPHRLQLRGGTYLEPTRFRGNSFGGRHHVTMGLDLRVANWNVFGLFPEDTPWRVGGALDVARDYLGWSATLGIWH
jgi:hypothetical protein